MSGYGCFPVHDLAPNGRKRMSMCGTWCDDRDLVSRVQDVRCAGCLAELKRLGENERTAEDVFGSAPSGAQVKGRDFDPTTGTTWKKPPAA